MSRENEPITELLRRSREGDSGAAETLAELLHQEMRKLAGAMMKGERPNHTLQPTALVHETWMRMCKLMEHDWRDRRQFFAAASHVMRQVLVDSARARRRQKRASGVEAAPLELVDVAMPGPARDVIALDDALLELEKLDPRKVRILEMRYFGGMTKEEIAEQLGISLSTIGRELQMAVAWLNAFA